MAFGFDAIYKMDIQWVSPRKDGTSTGQGLIMALFSVIGCMMVFVRFYGGFATGFRQEKAGRDHPLMG